MISQREVIKKHKKLLADFKNEVGRKNKVNCYTCHVCKHILKTIDIDAGVTPMIVSCEKCNNQAQSSMYIDVAPWISPTKEWYRPPLSKLITLRDMPNILHHIFQGGLMLRTIPKAEDTKKKDFIEGDFSM